MTNYATVKLVEESILRQTVKFFKNLKMTTQVTFMLLSSKKRCFNGIQRVTDNHGVEQNNQANITKAFIEFCQGFIGTGNVVQLLVVQWVHNGCLTICMLSNIHAHMLLTPISHYQFKTALFFHE